MENEIDFEPNLSDLYSVEFNKQSGSGFFIGIFSQLEEALQVVENLSKQTGFSSTLGSWVVSRWRTKVCSKFVWRVTRLPGGNDDFGTIVGVYGTESEAVRESSKADLRYEDSAEVSRVILGVVDWGEGFVSYEYFE